MIPSSRISVLLLAAWLGHFSLVLSQEPVDAPEAPAPDAPNIEGAPPITGDTDTEKSLEFLERSDFAISLVRNNQRQLDPFGLPMDPANATSTPMIAEQYSELDEVPVLNNSSLKSALETLPISGVYPKKSVVVLGARSFKPGDVFGMRLQELTIRLRFEGVRGSNVYFKDMDTQEVASVDFNVRPKEFEPIVRGEKPAPLNGIQPMTNLFIVN